MDSRIEKSLLFIAKSFQRELQLADLANEANLSVFHFHRLFRSETGKTPLEYINTIKLEYAMHYLMVYPESRMAEVAFESGFSSPSVFSRSFQQYYSTSPLVFRKANQTNPERNHIEVKEKVKIPIEYFGPKNISVNRVSLVGNALNNAYRELISNSENTAKGIGIYIDTPFHKKLEDCRHYVGVEHTNKMLNQASTIELPSGYYTHLTVNGPFDLLRGQVERFKEEKLDPSGYIIKSLIAFETIQLPEDPANFDYFSLPRQLYIQVGRK